MTNCLGIFFVWYPKKDRVLTLKYEKGRVLRKRAGGSTLLNRPRQITGLYTHYSEQSSVVELRLEADERGDIGNASADESAKTDQQRGWGGGGAGYRPHVTPNENGGGGVFFKFCTKNSRFNCRALDRHGL